MPRETKAEREAREAAERKAAERAQRAAERKAAREAAKAQEITPIRESGPQVIVIDFSDDVKLILRSIAASCTANSISKNVEKAAKAVKDLQEEIPQSPEPKVAPKKETAPTATVSLGLIRETLASKIGEGKKTEVVNLLKSYGAQNASSLESDQYNDFYNDLKEL